MDDVEEDLKTIEVKRWRGDIKGSTDEQHISYCQWNIVNVVKFWQNTLTSYNQYVAAIVQY